MNAVYALQVTEADHQADEFRTLGGAAWLTRAERDAAFAVIPEAPDEGATAPRTWIVDVLDGEFSIVADRCIDEATAMDLLGVDSLDELRARAIKRNEELAQEWLAGNPTQEGGSDGPA
ncbi:MAG: hypothetical protein JHD16_00450 [Solirubrobacteraceae bacterium]|nr:hypothetical protein [Solirubrobacteraceae bacterium]